MRRLLIVLLAGCTGTLSIIEPPGRDAETAFDSSVDAAVRDGGVDSDVAMDAGDRDAARTDSGTDTGVDAGPGDPCAAVSCGSNEICDPATTACVCRVGFINDGSGCVTPEPGDPTTRSASDMCAAWVEGHIENARPVWEDDGTMCGPGTMPRDAIDDTVRRINLFRWLSGMPNVTDDPARHAGAMECAAIMSANGRLSHSPPMDWACWTSAGASAASSSNIAFGYNSSAAAIDGYMDDGSTESLGHRRWILGRPLSSVGIGFSRVGSRAGQCLGVFGGGGTSTRAWSAYPNPGPTPLILARQRWWSFQAYSVRMTASTDAIVTRVSDGMMLPVIAAQTGGSGPPPTLRIEPDGWTAEAGETYRVTINNLSGDDITYDVMPIDC